MLPLPVTDIPGPESKKLARLLRRHESRNITYVAPDFPVFWEKSSGNNVWDVDGNRFIDLTSAFGVATAGHSPAWVKKTIRAQSSRLYHAMGDVHPTEAKARLCRKLSEITFERWRAGEGKVILGSNGADAVEAALKTSFLATGKPGFIAFEGAYHGLSLGTLGVAGREDFRRNFRPQYRELASLVPFPRREQELALVEKKIRRAVTGKIGAILVEPVQGRGGEVFPPHGFLKMLRRVADDLGLLLIFDEIYTGFYRTGTFFACEHERVVPDLVCLAKALASGYPISACVGKSAIMDHWPESDSEAIHTYTFLGNPLGCAMALESIAFWSKSSSAARVQTSAAQWAKALGPLRELPSVGELRGRGLLWGIELVDARGRPNAALAGRVIGASLQQGLLLLGGGESRNILTLCPPLGFTTKEIAWVIKVLAQVISVP